MVSSLFGEQLEAPGWMQTLRSMGVEKSTRSEAGEQRPKFIVPSVRIVRGGVDKPGFEVLGFDDVDRRCAYV